MRSLIQHAALALAAASLAFGAPVVHAQPKFPEKPIRFIVPFPPGGGNDILARAMQPRLAELLGQPVIVDNRGGAGGNLGTDLAAKSAPDGYTIVIASNQVTMNPAFQKLPFDIEKDFAPVALAASVPMVLVVHPSVPANNVREFIALAKAQPGKLNHATPGSGTPQHIAFEAFNHAAGIKVTHVPYKGTGPAIADLLGGQVQAAIATMASVEPHIKAGKLKALGVTTPKRSQAMPEIPTIAESGLAGYDVPLWYSILAPAGTPREVVGRLSSDIAKTLQAPDVRERLAQQGFEISYLNADQMSELIKRDTARWNRIIKDMGGVKVD
ncbi:tripartite tricarboxylate transporter substrate binding protein [Ramlibacter alkalitolerans]|uniref:Tripartite tricarboxylate transporter substrate binding protein n=1 Tax=Ramlibacter alkalitolerans TaxID=2039631 RepID=A0ABS1JQP3_9BURK|nr:tripartite tricarboxylate transporter substrate binding protein [Ramlibacter alkalitolerans]MBL0426471.1 tripartite tricarboxylate transporter substrate binding protein [Ramlibacter alkalitolerans]